MNAFLRSTIPGALLLFWLFATSLSGSAAVWRVATNAPSGATDGTSWSAAFTNLTSAITNAVAGDEIWVARGFYAERITLNSGVALLGGFSGVETNRDARDWRTNQTVLDGANLGPIITVAPFATNAVISGVVLQNGRSDRGSAIYVKDASIVIDNSTVQRNVATNGAAVYCEGGSVKVTASRLLRNNITGQSQPDAFRPTALFATNAIVELTDSQFAGNVGGPTIAIIDGVGSIEGNQIVANESFEVATGIFVSRGNILIRRNALGANQSFGSGGAAIVCFGTNLTRIENNVMAFNSALSFPGGAGGIFCGSNSNVRIINNTLFGNRGAGAGQMILQSDAVLVANNIIASGSSGILVSNAIPQIRNNNFFNNAGQDVTGLVGVVGADGNFVSDPLLMGDAFFFDPHLATNSPCRGTGLVFSEITEDYDGEIRPGAAPDVGADQFTPGRAPTKAIVHVRPDGNDFNSGDSWTNAMATLQAGLDRSCGFGGEIWARAGVYSESVRVPSKGRLVGGFAGNEVMRSQRELNVSPSRIQSLTNQPGVFFQFATNALIDGFTVTGSDRRGIYVSSSHAEILNCQVVSNTYVLLSGHPKFEAAAGGIQCHFSTATISNCLVRGNTGRSGGGIGAYYSTVAAFNNFLIGNNAFARENRPRGMGMHFDNSNLHLVNNLISDHPVSSLAIDPSGSGIYASYCAGIFANNTLIRNEARTTTWKGTVAFINSSGLTIANNVIAFNGDGLELTGTNSLFNNCLYRNRRTNYVGLADQTGLNGNISADPGLIAGGMLRAGSPCIDRGTNLLEAGSLDLLGRPRVVGSSIDIGAFEFDAAAPPRVPRVVCVSTTGSDLNDGATWATAKRSISNALEEVSLDFAEVWVASGTYHERLNLPSFVTLVGGFAGEESSRGERNWNLHRTIVDGENLGGAIRALASLDAGIDGVTLTRGRARRGGAVYMSNAVVTIRQSTLISNVAHIQAPPSSPNDGGSGSAIFAEASSRLVVENSLIARNESVSSGFPPGGTITAILDSTVALIGNTVAENSGDQMTVLRILTAGNVVQNNVIALNTVGANIPETATNSAAVRGNCFFNTTEMFPVPGNLYVDPRFVNPNGGDYRLSSGSPCLDQGFATSALFDLLHAPRLAGSRPDLGAFEWQGAGTNTPPTVSMSSPNPTSYVGITNLILSASANDAVGVAQVEFLVNGIVIGRSTNAPFQTVWRARPGSYVLAARAINIHGHIAESSGGTIDVLPPPGNSAPALTAVLRTNGAPARPAMLSPAMPFNVTVTTSDPNTPVLQELFINNSLVRSLPSPNGFSYSGPQPAPGHYRMKVRATDATGISSETNFVMTVVKPPRLTLAAGTSIRFDADPVTYQIQTSTNLIQWQTLSTRSYTNDSSDFFSPGATNGEPQRFYRLAVPEDQSLP